MPALILISCGRKTLPIPPNEALPLPVKDLGYQQNENKIILSWTYPDKTTSGVKLLNIESFQILRAVIPEKDFCAGCPVKYTSLLELAAEDAIKDPKARIAQYTETILRPEHRYFYKVKSKAGWRLLSDDSNQVSFSWRSPAEAPENLQAEAKDMAVLLTWSPAEKLLDGEKIKTPLLFQVYRAEQNTFYPVGEATSAASFTDSGLINGKTYIYKVKAIQHIDNTKITGMASRTVSATPKDMTAPLPPRNLITVTAKQGVKIIWDQSADKDIAGYKIYRRSRSGQDMTLIGQTMAPALFYLDEKLPKNQEGWYYSVSGFDNAVPPNESPISKEIYYESF